MKLILASTSPYRKRLLESLKIDFETCKPNCDEDSYKNLGLNPLELSQRLAKEKARSVLDMSPEKGNICVIGSDQVCTLNNEILDKPKSFEVAFAQLTKMQDCSHRLLTSVCVMTQGKTELWTHYTDLKMQKWTSDQIKNYLLKEEPYDCAGSYKIESLGIALMESIATEDFTGIQGLPLLKLSQVLSRFGFKFF